MQVAHLSDHPLFRSAGRYGRTDEIDKAERVQMIRTQDIYAPVKAELIELDASRQTFERVLVLYETMPEGLKNRAMPFYKLAREVFVNKCARVAAKMRECERQQDASRNCVIDLAREIKERGARE